jgi:hypothetical protein
LAFVFVLDVSGHLKILVNLNAFDYQQSRHQPALSRELAETHRIAHFFLQLCGIAARRCTALETTLAPGSKPHAPVNRLFVCASFEETSLFSSLPMA